MELTEILKETVSDYSLILLLMMIDLITGVAKSVKGGHKITSLRLKDSAKKMIVYFAVIVIAVVCSVFGTDAVKTLLIGYISLIEGLSILENLGEMFPKMAVLLTATKHIKKMKDKKEEDK